MQGAVGGAEQSRCALPRQRSRQARTSARRGPVPGFAHAARWPDARAAAPAARTAAAVRPARWAAVPRRPCRCRARLSAIGLRLRAGCVGQRAGRAARGRWRADDRLRVGVEHAQCGVARRRIAGRAASARSRARRRRAMPVVMNVRREIIGWWRGVRPPVRPLQPAGVPDIRHAVERINLICTGRRRPEHCRESSDKRRGIKTADSLVLGPIRRGSAIASMADNDSVPDASATLVRELAPRPAPPCRTHRQPDPRGRRWSASRTGSRGGCA